MKAIIHELLSSEAIGCEIDLPCNEDCSVSAAVCDVGAGGSKPLDIFVSG